MSINRLAPTALFFITLFIASYSFASDNKPAPSAERQVPVEYFNAPGAEQRNLPFSEAVRVGDLLFLSGKIGTVPGKQGLVKGGIQPETRQTMDNIKAVLERHGATMDHLVKCTVFLADIKEWAKMNEVYVTYFKHHKPARSALAASGLALDSRVEIECIASL
ncbi:hypothetical protein FLL45_09660 [Aliikangiella marina]|uniref:RidA family protein n=1 Tax=Aliikangiella marina TaxID=1712262 RepID=A0A545TDA3_9GAMM|nr:Rid family detoxifying hydrolase [Aliikangiella marina]TQV75195.1 hypothetical protein FLL45_09660 [Aliikangiella marina]